MWELPFSSSDHHVLTPTEWDRLAWEGGRHERDLMKKVLSADHPVVVAISHRLQDPQWRKTFFNRFCFDRKDPKM